MARPKGFRLHKQAFTEILRARRMDMSEVARMCHPPMPLTTLSGLVNGDHGASMQKVRQLSEGMDVDPEAIFPELTGRWQFQERASLRDVA